MRVAIGRTGWKLWAAGAAIFIIAWPGGVRAQEIELASDAARYIFDSALFVASGIGATMIVLAYGLRDVGLARSHHALGICLRMLGVIAVSALAFWLSGYNLIHMVEPGGLLGEFHIWRPDDVDPMTTGKSAGAYWLAEWGPASIAGAVVSSAVSERVKLWPFLLFAAALAGLIYPIAASWAWGGGYLHEAWSYYDFAGAGVIHMTAGAAALSAAFVVGPRPGKYSGHFERNTEPAQLSLTAFGAGLIALSWLFVLMGKVGALSSVEAAITIGRIVVNSILALGGGVLAALILTQTVYRRAGLVTASCAAVGGLVSIAADPLHPSLWQALMIGAVGGVIVTVAPPFLDRFRIDDAGLVVTTHLFCGAWGVIVAPWTNPDAWFAGQLAGLVGFAGFAALMSLLFWTALKYTLGVRIRRSDDSHGGFDPDE